MRSLTPPNGNHVVELKNLANSRLALKTLTGEIEARYATYQSKKKKLESVPALVRTQAERNAFESAYNTLRGRLNREMSELDAEAELCPYCLIECARDWDHFLPQKKFPDYAVYRPNLIRACTRCNRKKGDRFVATPRKTLNPYFDPIGDILFLKCEINTNHPLTAIFRVEPPLGTAPYLTQLIKRHFKTYGLARKYRAQASGELTAFIRALRYEVQGGEPLTHDLIAREADKRSYVLNLDPNHWKMALARGLAVAPNLYNYLLHQVNIENASDVA